jgi:HPt (histidine-containing phosphotransfer) domain-containing protein
MDRSCRSSKATHLELEETLRRLGGDRGLLRDLYAAYSEDMPKKIGALQQALTDEDLLLVHKIAHSLKGASAAVGARGCLELAQRIEEAALAAEVETLRHGILELQQELALAIAQMDHNA